MNLQSLFSNTKKCVIIEQAMFVKTNLYVILS